MRRRKMLLSLAFAMVVALLPANVFASDFRLRVEDISGGGSYGVVITDEGVGDEQPGAEGLIQVTLVPLNEAVTWNLTLGFTKMFFFDPSDPLGGMRLTSFNVTSTGATTLRVTLEDTGYANPGSSPAVLTSTLGGTFCGTDPSGNPAPCASDGAVTVAATSFASPSGYTPDLGPNSPTPSNLSPIGATSGPGVEQTTTLTATSNGTSPNDFSATTFTALEETGPSFSLFTQLIVTFEAAGSVDFFHDTMLSANPELRTPEPGALMLIGTALFGLAMRRRALALMS